VRWDHGQAELGRRKNNLGYVAPHIACCRSIWPTLVSIVAVIPKNPRLSGASGVLWCCASEWIDLGMTDAPARMVQADWLKVRQTASNAIRAWGVLQPPRCSGS
jgi:hypothetical protein